MQVRQAMTGKAEYISANTTLSQAAQKMRDLDVGFLPIGDRQEEKLQGVVTDRDITVRGIAAGKNPDTTTVSSVETDKVLYCFEEDSLEEAATSMQKQKVYRLIVLNSPDQKRLCGIVSLGDILQHGEIKLSAETARAIMA